MEHPMITEIERTGYPKFSGRREEYGVDGLGNEVFTGDEVLVIHEEFFLVEVMGQEAIEVLETLGAVYKTAK